MFIDPNARVRVIHPADKDKPESEQRYITLRRFLSQSQRADLRDAAAVVNMSGDGRMSIGRFQVQLLRISITGWGGAEFPEFKPELIDMLDENDPLVSAAASKAAELFNKSADVDPKG